jgi:two-component system, cell cycle sensor histidine kinase and response regulator CckA
MDAPQITSQIQEVRERIAHLEKEVVRLQNEAFLEQAAASYRAVLEASPVPMWITRDNRLVFVNTSALRVLGASSAEQMLGRSPFEFIHPDFHGTARDRIRKAIETGSHLGMVEERFVRLDGSVFDVEVTTSYLFYQGYNATLTNFSDITARKLAEERIALLNQDLSRRVREFESLLEVLPVGIGVADDASCRSIRANRTLADILGIDPSQNASKSGEQGHLLPFQFCQGGQEVRYEEMPMHLAAHTGVPVRGIELDVHRADGRMFQLLGYACPLYDERGEVRGSMGAYVDLTERKRLEEQLFQAQKMEAIGVLAGGVAHDFNNLLTIITGYGEMLVSELAGENRLQDCAQEILHAGERAAGLTSQLLAFSRRQVFQPKVLALNAVLTNMDKMLRRIIGEDIVLRTVASPEVGLIKADLVQIEQVILNLAVNARDAMPSGGTLTISVSDLEIEESETPDGGELKPGSYVLLTVSDTGCGMDAATQARIFEPFFTTKGYGKGTGLGLSTVYGIVRQSGGSISVVSHPGCGATFRIYLPRVFECENVPVPVSSQVARKASGTVLLVEDDASVRKLAAKVLRAAGYQVLEAADVEEAIRWPSRHAGHIEALLTDVVMPQMSGPDLADSLMLVLPHLKVLYMSGYSDNRLERPDFLKEGLPLIQKPFTPASLLAKVQELLSTDKGTAPCPDVRP